MRSLSSGGVRLPKFIAPRTSAAGSPGFLLDIAGVLIALVLLARFADGHTLGLSTSDFDVAADGRVEARFVFASAEALRGVRLDRSGDGNVTSDEVRAAQGELRAFILDGVGVTADGEACPATFDGAELSEVDGLVIAATFGCPSGALRYEATLYYLAALGAGHREVARITSGQATSEAMLMRDRRQVALVLASGTRGRALPSGARAAIAVAVLLAVGVAFAALRRARAQHPPARARIDS
jgi:hypothetical protein